MLHATILTGTSQICTAPVRMFDPQPALERARPSADRFTAQVYASGRFLAGDQVACFETELARAFSGTCAVACGTGTAALELCLRALALQPEDDVIVPANTSLFTAQAVLAAGARLRIADVDRDTLQLTARTATDAWSELTRAVIGVHLFGNPCPVDELAELCRQRGAALVQDACQAHGLRYHNRPLTDYSAFTSYSFYPTKNLGGVGDGGAVVTSNQELARDVRLRRDGGRDGDQLARLPGINSRLAELHAAHLRALLPHLEHWNTHRRALADLYRDMLQDVPGVRLVESGRESVRHLFPIRSTRRQDLREHLSTAGIETGIHYEHPLHRHPAFAGRATWAAEPSNAARACQEVVSLPIGPHVREADVRRVAEAIRQFAS